ncbi:GTPase activating protein (GAP) [Ophidiomyces ophidiicola]|nr:GTPase activating protein (GAP) [Ophidiomyces ophidiicola]KAI1921861.1 GTPase activating protein (GAP) [Ophidiomyces ophidiicola]KAI1959728.1 GTPase activating protein (GAP) [Ophidiomyces ophidiicola]KAI2149076.1 GTPase activating protein (GAP) [Ophidiomyces ophidiicola]KAI2245112.1 GTPase activating protein (GAP) [Ophidiomyces ophidiicola]
MFQLSSLVQKAQSLVDSANFAFVTSTPPDRNSSKGSLFRQQFRLPDSQNPLQEIIAELVLPIPYSFPSTNSSALQTERLQGAGRPGNTYEGRLHLSERFLCFSTQPSSFLQSASFSTSSTFTGQTNGTGPSGNGFTIPLCSIRRVERLNSLGHVFSLALTTWNGALTKGNGKDTHTTPQKFTLHLIGSRISCERFCNGLKKGLRESMKEVDSLRGVVAECHSEYMFTAARGGKAKDAAEPESTPREPPDTGLGLVFRYPGDARKLRDRSKMRLWGEYFKGMPVTPQGFEPGANVIKTLENGRNATIIRQPTFHKLVRVGLPNRLRGEIWEITSGSFYLRLRSPNLYEETLVKFSGRESLAIDEIEKDLNRSLPEYPGFQSEEGIGRLRRVLTAYSWTNEEVGYCQAMNIVVAALLMLVAILPVNATYVNFYSYMSEAQAFFILSVLCDRLLPGYYSTTMYGTLLDQKVFESLVEKTMPVLWEHLVRSDVQLSVVSLPWFLSLYINSMPLVFAFRVLDVFFLEGPKVLFQVGLAILRINGEELLDVTDDGTFISILKSYFARLDESAHPRSENSKLRAITRFQELMVVAFKEFSGITHATIVEERAKHKNSVLDSIEGFAKRTSIRNLGPESKKLSVNDLGAIYDRFYEILYDRQQRTKLVEEENRRKEKENRKSSARYSVMASNVDTQVGRVGLGPSPTHMDYDGFREFLAVTARWAVADSPRSSHKESFSDRDKSPYRDSSIRGSTKSFDSGNYREPADHDFIRRLFAKWRVETNEGLSLQNVVNGLAQIKGTPDIMNTINYFFSLYDDEGTGQVDREGILRMSEALLFLSRRGFEGRLISTQSEEQDHMSIRTRNNLTPEEKFLGSVSDFIQRCFEYADPSHPQNKDNTVVGDLEEANAKLDAFSIGDDDDDFSDLGDDKKGHVAAPPSTTTHIPPSASDIAPIHQAKRASETANIALDPAHPLHITLPTFRMVILADELLEQFFENFFPQSFHLSDQSISTSRSASLSSNLTTFANLGTRPPIAQVSGTATVAGASGGIVPPGHKGLRGVLDNIVSDGMRMAAEVKKRMDEAQREMERNALGRNTEDDEDEDDDDGLYDGRKRDNRSIHMARDRDRDLLEGAEAMSVKERDEKDQLLPSASSPTVSGDERRPITGGVNKVEFDS